MPKSFNAYEVAWLLQILESLWCEFFDVLDAYRLGLCHALMHDNLETKEGDGEQDTDGSSKEKLRCQRKRWRKV